MGNNKTNDPMGYKQSRSGHLPFYGYDNWRSNIVDMGDEKKKSMDRIKVAGLILGDLLGITGLFNGMLGKISSNSELIVFVIAAIYMSGRAVTMCAKAYFYIVNENAAVRRRRVQDQRGDLNGKHLSK